jgi:plasmid stability protein
VSIVVRSADDAIDAIRAASDQRSHTLSSAQRDILDAYFTTEGPPAAEAIADVIDELDPPVKIAPQLLHPGYRRVIEENIKSILPSKILDSMFERVVAPVAPEEYRRRSKQTQKFPGLTHHEIANRAEALASISEFSSPSIKKVRGTANTFLLS